MLGAELGRSAEEEGPPGGIGDGPSGAPASPTAPLRPHPLFARGWWCLGTFIFQSSGVKLGIQSLRKAFSVLSQPLCDLVHAPYLLCASDNTNVYLLDLACVWGLNEIKNVNMFGPL